MEAPESIYYDTHTMYVKSGIARDHQLRESMRISLEKVKKTLNRNIKCEYKTNIIISHTGDYYGFGFLWVSNPEVYHMLLGKNPDGTERVIYEDQPEDNTIDFSKCWGDYDDPAEKKISMRLEPLMELEGFDYDKEQIAYLRSLNEYEENENRAYFKVTAAYVRDVDSNKSHNVLCSRNIPSWVTSDFLKEEFSKFASDNKTKHKRKVNGKMVELTYPFAVINSKRIAFITFDQNNHDAQFALLMMKKFKVSYKGKDYLIMFDHSFKSPSKHNDLS